MSLLQYPDAVLAPDLQIWDNAAFDAAADGLPLRPISLNQCEPPGKENCVPAERKKPFQDSSKQGGTKAHDDEEGDIDAEIEAAERELAQVSARLEVLRAKKAERDARPRSGRVVPAKFMAMPAKKIPEPAARNLGTPAARKIVESPARNLEMLAKKKIPESPASRARFQHRRGVSLGPAEIVAGIDMTLRPKSCSRKLEGIEEEEKKEMKKETERNLLATPKSRTAVAKAPTATTGLKKAAESPAYASKSGFRRRGISVGPWEIAAATSIAAGACRSSKNHEAKEKVVKKEKGRSLSSSPKPRRSLMAKDSDLRKGVTTVGAKKPVKREDEPQSMSVKPKALFREEKNVVQGKRPVKNCKVRIVPSRYSLAASHANGDDGGSKRRKWSLPEPGKDGANTAKGERSLSLGESTKNLESENQLNSESETPSEVEGKKNGSLSSDESPRSIMKIAAMLPKIRTLRCKTESPRDSGCAKRVAELVGRKSHFGSAEEGKALASPCQSLTFEGEK